MPLCWAPTRRMNPASPCWSPVGGTSSPESPFLFPCHDVVCEGFLLSGLGRDGSSLVPAAECRDQGGTSRDCGTGSHLGVAALGRGGVSDGSATGRRPGLPGSLGGLGRDWFTGASARLESLFLFPCHDGCTGFWVGAAGLSRGPPPSPRCLGRALWVSATGRWPGLPGRGRDQFTGASAGLVSLFLFPFHDGYTSPCACERQLS